MNALLLALLLQTAPAQRPAAAPPAPLAEAPATASAHEQAAESRGSTTTHAPATPDGPPAQAEGHVPSEAQGSGAHASGEPGGDHDGPAGLLMHHVVDQRYGHLAVGPLDLGPTKHLVFFFVVALIVVFVGQLALRSYRGSRVPGGIGALVEIFVVFIRDEIADKNIGHADGRKFTPLLCSFFFIILVAALLGLVPFMATSTGNVSVTMGLAIVSFLAQQYAGISKYGIAGHFHNLIPPGIPKPLLIIMIPVEVLSMFTKPFALMIRLFANMLAGHMVIGALLMLIPLLSAVQAVLGILVIPVSLGLALFIMVLELLVALIQAYIFTLLTAIFIGMFAHPAH